MVKSESMVVVAEACVVESYCENPRCSARGFKLFLVKPRVGEKVVRAKDLTCPLCGRKSSRWVQRCEW